MSAILNKEIIDKLMEIKGEARGVVLKTDEEYILKEKGKKGLEKLEKRLKELGHPIKYNQIKTMNFYPVGLRILSLLVIKEIFNFDDKEIQRMGIFATKMSFIIKLFTKYFLSLRRVLMNEAPKIWTKHWTVGKLVPVKLDEKEKYAILRVVDFNLHPVYCVYLRGYFEGMLQMIVKPSKIISQETKCFFKGDPYHEFTVKWQ
jgi:hypothetical protein